MNCSLWISFSKYNFIFFFFNCDYDQIKILILANRYQESACVAELNALKECCKIWREESAVCKGIKIEPDNDSKPNATQKKVSLFSFKSLS